MNVEIIVFAVYLLFMLGIGVFFFIRSKGGGDKTALWQVNTEQSYHEQKEAGQ